MKLEELRHDPTNRRRHTARNLEMLEASLRDVGASRSIVIDETGQILAGNGTVTAASRVGLEKLLIVDAEGDTVVAVRRSGLTPAQKRALAIYDNRTAELAEWDWSQLDADRAAGLALAPWFTAEELEAGLEAPRPAGRTEPDAVPAPRATEIRRGDLFELEGHRLLCGDATSAEDVARVLEGPLALLVTDPPYNHGGRDEMETLSRIRPKSYGAIKRATWDQDFAFARVAPVLDRVLARDCAVYVFSSHHVAGAVWAWFLEWADYVSWAVWVKPNPMPCLHKRHWTPALELVCHCTRGKHVFHFPAEGHLVNVWTYPTAGRDGDARTHPTQKPVALLAHVLEHVSNPGDLVTDLFVGSGSTLMAAELLGRRARALELDPSWCQVTIDRWEAFTGKRAVKVGEGPAPARPRGARAAAKTTRGRRPRGARA